MLPPGAGARTTAGQTSAASLSHSNWPNRSRSGISRIGRSEAVAPGLQKLRRCVPVARPSQRGRPISCRSKSRTV